MIVVMEDELAKFTKIGKGVKPSVAELWERGLACVMLAVRVIMAPVLLLCVLA